MGRRKTVLIATLSTTLPVAVAGIAVGSFFLAKHLKTKAGAGNPLLAVSETICAEVTAMAAAEQHGRAGATWQL
eukprot:362265-Chlamydomonas_euryale.AAC.13